jgi:hypothetical protein
MAADEVRPTRELIFTVNKNWFADDLSTVRVACIISSHD